MKKTFEFTEQEAELLRKEQYKYLINDNIDHFLLLVQQIISERIAPEPSESGQSAEDVLKGMYGNNTQYGYSFNSTIEAMRLHASQVCADKDREIDALNWAARMNRSDFLKAQSELDKANESLAVMVRKNDELLNSVRPEVVVPSEKKDRNDYEAGWNRCLDVIKDLNPTITFAELNHNAPTGDKSDEG